MEKYEFTVDMFSQFKPVIGALLDHYKPKSILEIGCFEGQGTCFFIEHLGKNPGGYIACVDPWDKDMIRPNGDPWPFDNEAAYDRFQKNTDAACDSALHPVEMDVFRETSVEALRHDKTQYEPFDLIYIDGAHDAVNVLRDAVLAFDILKVGGIMVFDDYLWRIDNNPAHSPKLAIDAFTTIYGEKIKFISAPNMQVYVEKVAD